MNIINRSTEMFLFKIREKLLCGVELSDIEKRYLKKITYEYLKLDKKEICRKNASICSDIIGNIIVISILLWGEENAE